MPPVRILWLDERERPTHSGPYQRLRRVPSAHIWWQFNDWLDNLSWNFFYLKNWLLLKYFNWHRVWAALTGRCGHGSCFMTKYKTIFSIVFCAQPSSAQCSSGWVLHCSIWWLVAVWQRTNGPRHGSSSIILPHSQAIAATLGIIGLGCITLRWKVNYQGPH